MNNEGKFEAAAAFGDVIWHATDRLNLTFGLRYTHDAKEFSWLNGPRETPSSTRRCRTRAGRLRLPDPPEPTSSTSCSTRLPDDKECHRYARGSEGEAVGLLGRHQSALRGRLRNRARMMVFGSVAKG